VLRGSVNRQVGSVQRVTRVQRTAGVATQHEGIRPRQSRENAAKTGLHAIERKTVAAAEGVEQGTFRVFSTRFPKPNIILVAAFELIAVRTRVVRMGAPTRRMGYGFTCLGAFWSTYDDRRSIRERKGLPKNDVSDGW